MVTPWVTSMPGLRLSMASTLGSCQFPMFQVTKALMLVNWGWRGPQKPIFPSPLLKVCFTHSSYPPAFFPLPHRPIELSSVMHVIVAVVSD